MKNVLYIMLTFILLQSCNEYLAMLKTEEVGPKFKMGVALYEEGKWDKANRLFVQIVPNYRGKPQAEKLMFLYSDTFYKMGDYTTAAYQFNRFTTAYPESEKVEEAAFLSMDSHYRLSPVYAKDQSETKGAIEKIQNFIDTYPESEYIAKANQYFKDLEFKLEMKAYSIAKQYNHMNDHKVSIKALDNFIYEFPGSKLREDALFYKLDSAYKLATRSFEHLKGERLNTAKEYYNTLKRRYANSKYMEQANIMLADMEEQLKQLELDNNTVKG